MTEPDEETRRALALAGEIVGKSMLAGRSLGKTTVINDYIELRLRVALPPITGGIGRIDRFDVIESTLPQAPRRTTNELPTPREREQLLAKQRQRKLLKNRWG